MHITCLAHHMLRVSCYIVHIYRVCASTQFKIILLHKIYLVIDINLFIYVDGCQTRTFQLVAQCFPERCQTAIEVLGACGSAAHQPQLAHNAAVKP
jgi:hypothetical protein